MTEIASAPSTSTRPDAFAHPVQPHLVCDGAADAIAFYVEVFGAVEVGRLPGEDGRLMNACVEINGSPVMLNDSNPAWGALGPKDIGGSPVTVHLTVSDVDAVFARAVAAGATVKMEPQDMFWGDRYGAIVDPFGHSWSIATPQREVSREEMVEASKSCSMEGC